MGMPETMYGVSGREFRLVWRALRRVRCAGQARTPAPTRQLVVPGLASHLDLQDFLQGGGPG